jgi:hypothetical protein
MWQLFCFTISPFDQEKKLKANPIVIPDFWGNTELISVWPTLPNYLKMSRNMLYKKEHAE